MTTLCSTASDDGQELKHYDHKKSVIFNRIIMAPTIVDLGFWGGGVGIKVHTILNLTIVIKLNCITATLHLTQLSSTRPHNCAFLDLELEGNVDSSFIFEVSMNFDPQQE